MRKTTKGEGKIKVLRGRSAEVLNEHFAKLGKYALSDFTEEEREALDQALAVAEDSETRVLEHKEDGEVVKGEE